MSIDERARAIELLAPALGSLMHDFNNSLAAIAATAHAARADGTVGEPDIDAILAAVETGRRACISASAITSSRRATVRSGPLTYDVEPVLTRLAGRPVRVTWEPLIPPVVAEPSASMRQIVAVLWELADTTGAAEFEVEIRIDDGVDLRVTVAGVAHGPFRIAVARGGAVR